MHLKQLLPVMVLALICSCQSQQSPTEPESLAPAESRWTGQQSGEFVVSRDWWKQFGDEELNRLIDQAVSNNLSLANLVANVKIARENVDLSRSEGIPQFSAYGAATYGQQGTSDQTLSSEQYDAGIQMGWEVDIWGRLRSQTDGQLKEVQASEADWRAAYLTLVSNLARSYVRLRQFDEQKSIHHRALARNRDILRIYQERNRLGRDTSDQVEFQEAEVLRLANELEELDRQRRIEEHAIAELLGQTPGSLVLKEAKLRATMTPITLPDDLAVNLLERRPDIVAADLRLQKAYRLRDSAQAARLPRVTLGGGVGVSQISTMPRTWIASIIPQISFPSLDPATQTALNIKEIEIEVAQNNYKQAVNQAIRETLDALANYASHQVQLKNESLRNEKLQAAHRRVDLRFQKGKTSRLEVLDSERQLLGTQQGELAQYARLLQDIITVHTALGGGW